MQLQVRRHHELSAYLQAKLRPAAEERKRLGYATPKSAVQLQTEVEAAAAERDRLMTALSHKVGRLRAAGVLPGSDAIQAQGGGGGLGGVDAVLVACLSSRLNTRLYSPRPLVSFIAQYFKRPWAIDALVNATLRCGAAADNTAAAATATAVAIAAAAAASPSGSGTSSSSGGGGLGGASSAAKQQQQHAAGASFAAAAAAAGIGVELVVNVDSHAEAAAWAAHVSSSGGRVVPVFSDNVHEIRGYNRAVGSARGDYVILLQDDATLTDDCSTWLRRVVDIFEAYPAVGIVGLKNYRLGWGRPGVTPGVWDRDFQQTRPVRSWFANPALGGAEMMWVPVADWAPMAVRRSALLDIGGIDEGLSEPGECGIVSDADLSYRMWLAGWQVTWMPVPRPKHDGKVSGTHRPEAEERCWGKQMGVAGSVAAQRLPQGLQSQLAEHCRQLNSRFLKLLDPAACPYTTHGCDASRCAITQNRTGCG